MQGDDIVGSLARARGLAELAVPWLAEAGRDYGDRSARWPAQAVEQLRKWFDARCVVVTRQEGGATSEAVRAGSDGRVPEALVSEVLDADTACRREAWIAAPLDPRQLPGTLLAVEFSSAQKATSPIARGAGADGGATDPLQLIAAAATLLGMAWGIAQRHEELRARLRRGEALLKIVGQWNQHRETETLLAEMARTSTELLDAERASIFLWDRAHHELIGRPALGVAGGELRVPDDRGVVGHVVQRGEPLRVDERDAVQWVDRQVDQRLGFSTKNLMCVPLRDKHGTVIGAFELINKRQGPFTAVDLDGLTELAAHASLAIETSQHIERLLASRRQVAEAAAAEVELVGRSAAIEQVRATVRRVAPTDLCVLVLGENGTGKEVVSRLLHYLSPRRDHPLVAVNCAAMAESLLESELFGHEQGAFTDARETKQGKFELASGGTLLLDEIGDLSPGGQAKLLRVLEDKVVVRVGGTASIPVDTRVIAATNQDLAALVEARRFRRDLYYRLNVVPLTLPPLRDRPDDIELLAEHFLEQFCRKAKRLVLTLTADARQRLRRHGWPGNVRELRNLMERLAFLHAGPSVSGAELAAILAPSTSGEPELHGAETLNEATRLFQIHFIRRQIAAAGGNVSDAARRMGLHRSNLYRKMRQLKMDEATAAGEEEDEAVS